MEYTLGRIERKPSKTKEYVAVWERENDLPVIYGPFKSVEPAQDFIVANRMPGGFWFVSEERGGIYEPLGKMERDL